MSGHDFSNPNSGQKDCPAKKDECPSSASPKCKKKYNPHNPCEQSDTGKKKCVKTDPCHKFTPKDKQYVILDTHDFSTPIQRKKGCPDQEECPLCTPKCKKEYNSHNICEQSDTGMKKCVKIDPYHKFTSKDK